MIILLANKKLTLCHIGLLFDNKKGRRLKKRKYWQKHIEIYGDKIAIYAITILKIYLFIIRR